MPTTVSMMSSWERRHEARSSSDASRLHLYSTRLYAPCLHITHGYSLVTANCLNTGRVCNQGAAQQAADSILSQNCGPDGPDRAMSFAGDRLEQVVAK